MNVFINLIKVKLNEMSDMILNENESSQSSRVILSGQETSTLLTFLADTVNLYNWYLRRGENPRCLVYDETQEVVSKLYEELYKRTKEDIHVSLTLRTIVWIFKLDPLDGVYDEGDQDEGVEPIEHYYGNDIDNTNARLWCQFVQRRQRSIADRNSDGDGDGDWDIELESKKECEELLWGDVYNTTDSSALYENLIMLEREYIEIIEYGNTRVSSYNSDGTSQHMMPLLEVLYNSMNSVGDGETLVEEVPPAFGVGGLELERVYLQDYHTNREGGDENLYNSMNFDADFHNAVNSSSSASAYEGEESRYEEGECGAVPELCVFDKHMVSELECPICYEAQESGDEGVRTMCGHEYCGPCFWSMVARKSECGMCRSVIREYVELTVV
jgi:hypothetical protein